MKSFDQFINYITEHTDELATTIVERVCNQLPTEVPEAEQQQALLMYKELWESLAESLRDDLFEIPEALMKWSRSNAAMQTEIGGKISVIVDRYPPTRAVFSDVLVEISEDVGLSLKEFARVNKQVNTLMDISLNETYYAFERLSELYRSDTEQELAQLSAPIVPVKDGIIIIPFIGEITDDRSYAIMNNVLPRVASMDVMCAIADFSGLVSVDDHVVRSLHQIEDALSLMGIQVITTGLRPELAQKIVNSGMDFAGTEYYATVKQALESLL
ncbi:STAS domain-containing protein [Sporosarcina sp. BI001-red]|uniref:STAS domain-containing protein n=1 Tax=Sporosarcina sp. BI001-red TaxID=2282866 RepID=UPI000E247FDA|nr:STAS domain-containing protein [Sporosarcina sp. BI001-red]REB08605.1 STAS domain-containing protein [Sporosarcina sp. BI001-red]